MLNTSLGVVVTLNPTTNPGEIACSITWRSNEDQQQLLSPPETVNPTVDRRKY